MLQDCVQLLTNLLRDNPANQLMFRESGHLANIPSLLRLPSSTAPAHGSALQAAASAVEAQLSGPGAGSALGTDVASNLQAAMELVTALLTPMAHSNVAKHGGAEALRGKLEMANMCLEANHALLAKTQLCAHLLELALLQGQGVACNVRRKALQTLCAVVTGRQSAQDAAGNASVTVRGATVPAIQVRSIAIKKAECHDYLAFLAL
jgi:hypothetical protein